MKIIDLRILPPIAVGRLGASATPLDAFQLTINDKRPLDYREITPVQGLEIDNNDGSAKVVKKKRTILFKDAEGLDDKNGTARPVAPFLEIFAITDEAPGILQPLTTQLLEATGLSLSNISWNVRVGNIKMHRRTFDVNDRIYATLTDINDHKEYELLGECLNFLPGKKLPFGKIRFIRPTEELPGLRLRFTPAAGRVYGASLYRHTSDDIEERDPVIKGDDQILYDTSEGKGTWRGYKEISAFNPVYTNPAQIFAGYSNDAGDQVSWGYFDDECDGLVEVLLKTGEDTLSAFGRIGAGPPAYAPDSLPIRVASDELEQILYGPDPDKEVSIEEAEDIVRRALDTVRLMNTAVMNGNPFESKLNQASSMVRQNSNDFGRFYEPIMAPDIMDNLAVRALHERVFAGLATGASPWFSEVFRRPDEIGDLSSKGLRKMPALMRGADGRLLTLTHRQIRTVIMAATTAIFDHKIKKPENKASIAVDDFLSQLHYEALGNPYSVLPRSAISNSFPGLEYDFRNLWRRAFKGITLIENNNNVVETENQFDYLLGCRLVAVEGKLTMVGTTGPQVPDNIATLITHDNPNGVSFMEWSNSLAHVLQKQGQQVQCTFTKEASPAQIVVTADELNDTSKFRQVTLTVNTFFRQSSAEILEDVLKPGELTQGLCSPWQNDYRECACYYWAASRPDYVNIVPNGSGTSAGDNWMAKKRTGKYIPDDRKDKRLQTYDDLFINWQGELNFIIKGRDALGTEGEQSNDVG